MPNIFDGLNNTSEEELREYIAILETYTIANFSKQTGQKVAKKFVQATNLVAGLMKKAPFETPEVMRLDELLETHQCSLKTLKKDELMMRIKQILIGKCNNIKAGELEEKASDDMLYVKIINHAAELYEIMDELLPSQKAEMIKKSYLTEIKLLNKEIEKAHNEETHQTDEKKEIKAIEEKDLHRLLLEESFSAIPTPIGKNRLIRLLFAQLIGRSMETYGESFIPKDEVLPSWLPLRERMELDRVYQGMLQQHYKNEEKYEHALQSLLEKDNQINSKKREIEYIQGKKQEQKERIQKLINEKDRLLEQIGELNKEKEQIEVQRLTKEVKMKESRIVTYENMVQMNKEEIKSANQRITALQTQREDISKLVKEALKEKDKTQELLRLQKEARQNEIEEKWKHTYKQFSFEESFIHTLISKFTMYEIQEIERGLFELHQSQDVQAFSIGTLDEEDLEHYDIQAKGKQVEHIVFRLAPGILGIILYEVKDEENHKAHILNVIKVKDEDEEEE